MRLTLIMPTLLQRRSVAAAIRGKLHNQISASGMQDEVELLTLEDDGGMAVGQKRNQLVERARGDFIAHVDDDDDVNSDYVSLVVGALRRHPEATHLGIRGFVTFRGKRCLPFVMSNRYRGYRFQHGCYTRPPHHLNPVRTEIARRYSFEAVRSAEDSDWALRVARDGVLDREVMIQSPLYYYRSRRFWAYECFLDRTEWLRHPLGLQFVHRHRLRRWMRTRWA